MRGCPGSGKSTMATKILNDFKDNGVFGEICSTDSFFITNGEYTFDAKKLAFHHKLCYEKAVNLFNHNVKLVILDNTNVRRTDFVHYIQQAMLHQYIVLEIVVGLELSAEECHVRNTHNVPLLNIQRMRETLVTSLRAKSLGADNLRA